MSWVTPGKPVASTSHLYLKGQGVLTEKLLHRVWQQSHKQAHLRAKWGYRIPNAAQVPRPPLICFLRSALTPTASSLRQPGNGQQNQSDWSPRQWWHHQNRQLRRGLRSPALSTASWGNWTRPTLYVTTGTNSQAFFLPHRDILQVAILKFVFEIIAWVLKLKLVRGTAKKPVLISPTTHHFYLWFTNHTDHNHH